MHKGIAAAIITGSLLTGGAVGTALFGPGVAGAQESSSDSSSSDSTQSETPAPPEGRGPRGPRGLHGPRGHVDLAVVADAIGVSEDDLRTALQSGQSMADVATANGIDPQTVIDALVADAQAKLAEKVASGEITQERADEISAGLVERITDVVNRAGFPGPGGPGCPDKDGEAPPALEGSSDSSTSSSSGTSLDT